MKLIYDIYRKLRKQEIRQIKHHIKYAAFELEKVGKLFELVTRFDEREEAFYSQKIYQRDPDNTFRVTKSRLKRLLENALLQDKSLSGYRAAAINASLQARKKLLQGEILLGRGAYAASKNLLFQVISTARKFELDDLRFQAELLLYRHHNILSSVREYEKKTEDLLSASTRKAQIEEATIRYYHLTNHLLHQTLPKTGLAHIRAEIDRLAHLSQATEHPQVSSLYLLAENYYHQTIGDFDTSLTYCQDYLHLLESNETLRTPTKLNGAFVQLTKVCLLREDLASARSYGEQVLKGFSPEEVNYLVGLELAFRIEFHSGDNAAARAHIEAALAHPNFESSSLLSAKWYYYLACTQFRMGEFRQAYKSLNETTPLLSDKYGRNLSIRLLEIMILFELGHLDILEAKILNLRQFIKRTQQKEEMFRPAQLIRILLIWHKHQFDTPLSLEKARQKLDALAAYHERVPFKSLDFELVRLEQWLQAKQT